jgi:hypothetical protein
MRSFDITAVIAAVDNRCSQSGHEAVIIIKCCRTSSRLRLREFLRRGKGNYGDERESIRYLPSTRCCCPDKRARKVEGALGRCVGSDCRIFEAVSDTPGRAYHRNQGSF